ncbi:MAG: cyanophycinase [Ignavibacteriaceae bacterium]|nr:cyanophycinase [Ignavibacteriaceae bacterium]
MKTLILVLIFTVTIFSQGNLVIIGGGKRSADIMEKIVELAGGSNAKILIIPNASSEPIETGEYQKNEMLKFGAGNSEVLYFDCESANSDSVLAQTEGATGVFFSGGDQNKLTEDLLGTKLLAKIFKIYEDGGVISGTSAGAAVMSNVMITGNELKNLDSNSSYISIEEKNIQTAQGFGFVKGAIVDQHFATRKRHNRLISLVLENPELVGIGIDESTAIWVKQGGVFEVIGKYNVLVFDAREATGLRKDESGGLFGRDIKMSVLGKGDVYELIKK